jgi:hypothetical protein
MCGRSNGEECHLIRHCDMSSFVVVVFAVYSFSIFFFHVCGFVFFEFPSGVGCSSVVSIGLRGVLVYQIAVVQAASPIGSCPTF